MSFLKNFIFNCRPGSPRKTRSRCVSTHVQSALECLEQRILLAAVYFDPEAVGDSTKSVAEWGVDTAWPDARNVRLSVQNLGLENVDVVRVNFYLEEALTAGGELGPNSQTLLNAQLALAETYAPGKPLALTPSI